MKIVYLFIAAVLLASIQLSAQTWDWTKPEKYGTVFKVVTDTAGNVYELGSFTDSLFLDNSFIKTGNGNFIAKYSATGTRLWYKTIERTSSSSPWNPPIITSDIVVNSSGVYIAGRYDPDVYYNDNSNCASGYQPITYSIAGTIVNTSPGDMGLFVSKLDRNGNVKWNKTGNADTIVSGCTTSAGIMPIGSVILSSDKNNNLIVAFTWDAERNSDFAIGSDKYTVSFVNGATDITQNLVVAKYNSSGQRSWYNYAYQNGSYSVLPNAITCKSIITNSLGNIYLNCSASDSTAFGNIVFRTKSNNTNPFVWAFSSSVLVKMNAAGTWLLAKEVASGTIDSYNNYNIQNLAVDNVNNVYVTANLANIGIAPRVIAGDTIPPGNIKDFLVKYDINENYKWKKEFGSSTGGGGYAGGIFHLNNNLYLSGSLPTYFSKYLDFAPLTVPHSNNSNSGATDYFVAKADTSGTFTWVQLFSGTSNATGLSVAAFGTNVYTSGSYTGAITSLGNLNGSFNSPNGPNPFTGTLIDRYIRVGAVTPTQLIPGCTITILFKSTGLSFSAANTFTAELSDANGDFGSPTVIGTTVSKGTGSITATIPASLVYGSGFRVRIHSSDTLKTGFKYYAYADTGYKLSLVCPAPSSGFVATNITATAATLNWTAVGCAAGYKVQYRLKGTTGWTTVNITTNTATLNITGLSANTIYQWKVATKCRNNGTNSFSAFSSNKQFTTAAAFASSAAAEGFRQQTTGFSVYPNPARQMATVEFNGAKPGNCIIEVADLTGRVLYRKNINATNGLNKQNIDLNSLAAAVYIVTLTQADHSKQAVKVNKE